MQPHKKNSSCNNKPKFSNKTSSKYYPTNIKPYQSNLKVPNIPSINFNKTLEPFTSDSKIKKDHLESQNHIEIPKHILKHQNLEVPSHANNKINFLPEEISEFKNLKILLLQNNKIKTIPLSFGNILRLEVLNLERNPPIEPFSTLYKKGNYFDILAYCRDMNIFYDPPKQRKQVQIKDLYKIFQKKYHEKNICPYYSTSLNTYNPLNNSEQPRAVGNILLEKYSYEIKPELCIKSEYKEIDSKELNLNFKTENWILQKLIFSFDNQVLRRQFSYDNLKISMKKAFEKKFRRHLASLFTYSEGFVSNFFKNLITQFLDFYRFKTKNIYSIIEEVTMLFFIEFLKSKNLSRGQILEKNTESIVNICVVCKNAFSKSDILHKTKFKDYFNLKEFTPNSILKNSLTSYVYKLDPQSLESFSPYAQYLYINKSLFYKQDINAIEYSKTRHYYSNHSKKFTNRIFKTSKMCKLCIYKIKCFYFGVLINESFYRTQIVNSLRYLIKNDKCLSEVKYSSSKIDNKQLDSWKTELLEYRTYKFYLGLKELEKFDSFLLKINLNMIKRSQIVEDDDKNNSEKVNYTQNIEKTHENSIDLKYVIRFAFLLE